MWPIVRQVVMEGILVAGQQNAHISDTLQRRDVAMATISVFPYTGCTLESPCVAAMRSYVKLL